MNQITLRDAEGLTVNRVFHNWGDAVLVVFVGGTFATLRAVQSYDQALLEEDGASLRALRSEFGDEVLVEAGITTREALAEADRASEQEHAARREAQERREFERLRAKYGE